MSKPWSSPITRAMELPPTSLGNPFQRLIDFTVRKHFPDSVLNFRYLISSHYLTINPLFYLSKWLGFYDVYIFQIFVKCYQNETQSEMDKCVFCYFNLLWQIDVWSPLHIYCPVWTQLSIYLRYLYSKLVFLLWSQQHHLNNFYLPPFAYTDYNLTDWFYLLDHI